MREYTSKQQVVRAFQFGIDSVPSWCPRLVPYYTLGGEVFVYVTTTKGLEKVFSEDWILLTEKGTFQVVRKLDFYESFQVKVDLTVGAREMALRSTDAIFETCRKTAPYNYCLAHNVSESMTELVMTIFSFELEDSQSKRAMLLTHMESLINYEKQFT